MPVKKNIAVILKRINLGEADRIVTAFSKEHGKIKFVAKGVRRTKSKLAGSIEPFCLVDINLSDTKSLDILTSAHIIDNYIGLTPELERVKLANLIAEIIDKMLPENSPNIKIFNTTTEVLARLNESNVGLLKLYFLSKYFYQSGVSLEVKTCVKCGNKPNGRIFLSLEAGGILDNDCALHFRDSKETDVNLAKLIKFSSENSLSQLEKLTFEEKYLKEAINFLNKYLKLTTGKVFKSENI